MSDKVNHPQHYQGKYEVWDVLDDWFPNNPTLWNCVKYLSRCDRKGNPLEDLKKARVYLEREIERREAATEDKSEVRIACSNCHETESAFDQARQLWVCRNCGKVR